MSNQPDLTCDYCEAVIPAPHDEAPRGVWWRESYGGGVVCNLCVEAHDWETPGWVPGTVERVARRGRVTSGAEQVWVDLLDLGWCGGCVTAAADSYVAVADDDQLGVLARGGVPDGYADGLAEQLAAAHNSPDRCSRCNPGAGAADAIRRDRLAQQARIAEGADVEAARAEALSGIGGTSGAAWSAYALALRRFAVALRAGDVPAARAAGVEQAADVLGLRGRLPRV
jgi:hypothetical protein